MRFLYFTFRPTSPGQKAGRKINSLLFSVKLMIKDVNKVIYSIQAVLKSSTRVRHSKDLAIFIL